MKMRSVVLLMLALGLMLGIAPVTAADDRPHEGKVISVDRDSMVLIVQGDKDDQWTLSWTPTTKLKGDLAVEEIKVGDKVHFDFTEKDGRKWLTELRRTDKAKAD